MNDGKCDGGLLNTIECGFGTWIVGEFVKGFIKGFICDTNNHCG